MTEIESDILEKVKEIKAILLAKGFSDEYLSILIIDGEINFNNNFWESKDKIRYMEVWNEKNEFEQIRITIVADN